jgi:hypothetical protein
MSIRQRICKLQTVVDHTTLADMARFVDCEKWRSDFGGGVDALVPGWDYKEKEQMFKYYPQYYHKTDKV